jgi:hypothetical protein
MPVVGVSPWVLKTGVAVEKLHFPQNGQNLGIENV